MEHISWRLKWVGRGLFEGKSTWSKLKNISQHILAFSLVLHAKRSQE